MADVAERLKGLHALRLPELAPDALVADFAAGAAAGLVLALIAALLARLLLYRPATLRQRLRAALEESRHLPPEERVLAQARLLERLAEEFAPRVAGRSAPRKEEATPDRRDWQDLGRRLGSDFFAKGPGARLREALYRPGTAIDPDAVDRELARLLGKARRRP